MHFLKRTSTYIKYPQRVYLKIFICLYGLQTNLARHVTWKSYCNKGKLFLPISLL